jgi:6-phosphogluconolactonase
MTSRGVERKIVVRADDVALAETAARRLIDCIAASPTRSAICLTGGSTPERLYRLLATIPWHPQIPWQHVHWFITDERFVPSEHPLSNIGMARRAFLDACAPPQNVHAINTAARTPEEAAELYQKILSSFHTAPLDAQPPLFDLVLMGVGPDGHTASLFPDSPASREQEKWVVGVPKANVSPFVPRISLTFPCLASTKEMLFLASGKDKRAILTRVFANENLPVTKARSAFGETVWLLDEAAAPEEVQNHQAPASEIAAIIVMGVSGSGKTTIAEALAKKARICL